MRFEICPSWGLVVSASLAETLSAVFFCRAGCPSWQFQVVSCRRRLDGGVCPGCGAWSREKASPESWEGVYAKQGVCWGQFPGAPSWPPGRRLCSFPVMEHGHAFGQLPGTGSFTHSCNHSFSKHKVSCIPKVLFAHVLVRAQSGDKNHISCFKGENLI